MTFDFNQVTTILTFDLNYIRQVIVLPLTSIMLGEDILTIDG